MRLYDVANNLLNGSITKYVFTKPILGRNRNRIQDRSSIVFTFFKITNLMIIKIINNKNNLFFNLNI